MAFSSCVFSDNLNHNLCAGATATAGPSTAPINVQGIFDDLKLATITSLGAPYSVLQEWDVTMGGHSSINYGSDTNLINVPEPASLAIFGSALLGFGLIRRRRRNG
jgi:hypothetical protein